MKKKSKSFDMAYGQYRFLADQLNATSDVREKNILFRRLSNLLNVMEFLLNPNQLPN